MRKLGQHFLKDEAILKKIADTVEVKTTDTIVEIGPGHGELTKHLVKAGPEKIIAIERDKKLAEELIENFSGVEVITGDALTTLPKLPKTHGLSPAAYKIVGNIPYYITGKLLRIIGELKVKPSLVVFTVQKEVALRLTAKPPKMNLLAASVGFWGTPEIIKTIKKGSFKPVPKVDSATIKITPVKADKTDAETTAYYTLVKALFRHPRKTIANNLKSGLDISKNEMESMLKSHDLDPNLRPQDLNIDTINTLSHNLI